MKILVVYVAMLNWFYIYISVGVSVSVLTNGIENQECWQMVFSRLKIENSGAELILWMDVIQDKSEDVGHLKQNSGNPKKKRDELQLRTSPRKKLGDTSPKKIDELKLRTSPRKKEGASNLKKNDEYNGF